MNVWHSFGGMLEVVLTSADLEKTFFRINSRKIEISNLVWLDDLTCSFRIHRRAYPELQQLCAASGENLKIRKRIGLYWIGKSVFSRPVFLIGTVWLILLAIWLPTRVLFIRVDGNQSVPEKRILEAAENCGIAFGASRRAVRSEKMKNGLLEELPELQWAGINTYGCTAVISVRERALPEQSEEDHTVMGIAASRDGYILSCTVTQGTGLVQPGDTVKEGQMLISAYTDCGLCIRAEKAEGDVIAQTNRDLKTILMKETLRTEEIGGVKRKISLLVRKKRIFLWKDSGISDTTCGRMYEEYYVTLPGGFRLPVALCMEEFREREIYSLMESGEAAAEKLAQTSERYLLQHMIAGEILDRTQSLISDEEVFRFEARYVCKEMIGKRQQEQIGDINGKNG